MTGRAVMLMGVLAAGLLQACALSASDLKPDEQVVLFPVDARASGEGVWSIPMHGWVFEYEEGSHWREGLVNLLTAGLKVPDDAATRERFHDRLWMFLVDNERGKDIVVRVGDESWSMQHSEPSGHFHTEVEYRGSEGGWLDARVDGVEGTGPFPGRIRLLPPQGVSVISDIDDTIKISQVYDRKLLMANTFINPWQAVPGMAALYRSWAQDGAQFHYVSGSPWQLYPALNRFLLGDGFPEGSYALRYFRIKDRTLFEIMDSPEAHKNQAISDLLQRFPQRRFILVGDSTESDPEIYADMARRYPEQIAHIFIRNVLPEHNDPERYAEAFKDLNKQLWDIFVIAEDIDIAISTLKKMDGGSRTNN